MPSKLVKINDRKPVEIYAGRKTRGPISPIRLDDNVIGRILRSIDAPRDIYAVGPNSETVRLTLDNYKIPEEDLFKVTPVVPNPVEEDTLTRNEALKKSLEAANAKRVAEESNTSVDDVKSNTEETKITDDEKTSTETADEIKDDDKVNETNTTSTDNVKEDDTVTPETSVTEEDDAKKVSETDDKKENDQTSDIKKTYTNNNSGKKNNNYNNKNRK